MMDRIWTGFVGSTELCALDPARKKKGYTWHLTDSLMDVAY